MALIQARGRLECSVNGWVSSGLTTVANGSTGVQNTIGMLRNSDTGFDDNKNAVPNGHLAPSAWKLPMKPGGMSSTNEAAFTIVATGNAAQGLNRTGNSPITFTTSGEGAAVAAAIGSSTITFTTSGTAVAPFNAVGESLITFFSSGDISGKADITGTTIITFTSNLTTRALGFMTAVPIDTTLTPEGVAEAVWDRLVSLHPTEGSAGQVLTSAQKAAKLAAALSA